MCKIIAVTNQSLCNDHFYEKIIETANQNVYAILLRENDLTMDQYQKMYLKIRNCLKPYAVELIMHCGHFSDEELIKLFRITKPTQIHCSLQRLMEMKETKKINLSMFSQISVSVHSVNQAIKAQKLGATCLIAGHIFKTACKGDLNERGLIFLNRICKIVEIPVYAIGGINENNMKEAIDSGAKGVCMMSNYFK